MVGKVIEIIKIYTNKRQMFYAQYTPVPATVAVGI